MPRYAAQLRCATRPVCSPDAACHPTNPIWITVTQSPTADPPRRLTWHRCAGSTTPKNTLIGGSRNSTTATTSGRAPSATPTPLAEHHPKNGPNRPAVSHRNWCDGGSGVIPLPPGWPKPRRWLRSIHRLPAFVSTRSWSTKPAPRRAKGLTPFLATSAIARCEKTRVGFVGAGTNRDATGCRAVGSALLDSVQCLLLLRPCGLRRLGAPRTRSIRTNSPRCLTRPDT